MVSGLADDAMSKVSSDEILVRIHGISLSLKKSIKQMACRTGLTGQQLEALMVISGMEEATVSDIAKSASLSVATASQAIDQLVRLGLVSRHRSVEDRRMVLVRISEKGAKKLLQVPPVRHKLFSSRFSRLQSWEQAMLVSAVQRLSRLVEENGEGLESPRSR